MDWTAEIRLELIKKLLIMHADTLHRPNLYDLFSRILFLCEMSPEFLEINKVNFQDAIEYQIPEVTK